MTRRYDDFDLVFRQSGEGYCVQLINSPTGQAECEFALPFTPGELRNFYSRIGQLSRSTRRVDRPEVAAAKRFGGDLFNATFKGELLGCYRGSVERSRENGHGLRVRLRLKATPELAELPWEFLYDQDQDHFIATSTMTPLVRYLDLPQSAPALRVRLPLRVLVVISGPRNLPTLDADGEWDRLKLSLKDLEDKGLVILERLPSARLDMLRRRARGDAFHVLHFIGHGSFDTVANDGALHFEDAIGMSDPVHGNVLGNVLRDHFTMRLAVLNACEGARQSNQDPFSGVAQSLCQQGLPAVIAMQFEISDDAAKTFAEEFYAAVADSLPVDAALSESRKALFSSRFGQEWATPVLYMRSQSGMLFEVQRAERSANREHPAAQEQSRSASPQHQPDRAESDRQSGEGRRAAEAEAARKSAEEAETQRRLESERLAADSRRKAAEEETRRQAEAERVAAQVRAREEEERRAEELQRQLELQRIEEIRQADVERRVIEAQRQRQAQQIPTPIPTATTASVPVIPVAKPKGNGWVIGLSIAGLLLGLSFSAAMHLEYATPKPIGDDDLGAGIVLTLIGGVIARWLLRRLAKRPKGAWICAGAYAAGYVFTLGPSSPYFGIVLPLIWALMIVIPRPGGSSRSA